MICESHHEDDIDDFTKYRVDNVYGNDKNVQLLFCPEMIEKIYRLIYNLRGIFIMEK